MKESYWTVQATVDLSSLWPRPQPEYGEHFGEPLLSLQLLYPEHYHITLCLVLG